jgi:ribosomal protein S18 acetylase RimI-like enzyme
MHPDWRVDQRRAVEAACADDRSPVWVAITADDGTAAGGTADVDADSEDREHVVGFVVAVLDREPGLGEITMIAVDPDHQGRGTGSALTAHALRWLEDHGMAVAMVETGGDEGHAPARRLYERAGFVLLPVARYFKRL